MFFGGTGEYLSRTELFIVFTATVRLPFTETPEVEVLERSPAGVTVALTTDCPDGDLTFVVDSMKSPYSAINPITFFASSM